MCNSNRILLLLTLCVITSTAVGTPLYNINAAVGYSTFTTRDQGPLVFSNYIFDRLLPAKQNHNASFNLDAKRLFTSPYNGLEQITLGPALYFQKSAFTGDVWELGLPEFYNFRYQYGSENTNLFIEANLYFKSIHTIQPFITAGLGLGFIKAYYDDTALPNIPLTDEKHWANWSTKPSFDLGLGLALPLSEKLSVNAHYAYINSGTVTVNALVIKTASQNVFFGINYLL